MPRQRVPRLVRAGKTHLQEKRLLALVIADPSKGRVADKHIRVKALLQVPRNTLVFLQPIGVGLVAIVGPLQAVNPQIATPIVVGSTHGEVLTGGILHHDPLVETPGDIARSKVHLADVDAVITRVVEVLHPIAVIGPVVKAVHTGIVRVHTREDRRPRGNAGRARAKGIAEGKPLRGQAVHGRRNRVVVAPSADRVEALLVGHNEDDIGSLYHGTSSNPVSASAPSSDGTPKNTKLNAVGCMATAPR